MEYVARLSCYYIQAVAGYSAFILEVYGWFVSTGIMNKPMNNSENPTSLIYDNFVHLAVIKHPRGHKAWEKVLRHLTFG